MNKNWLKLFFIIIVSFIVLDQKCSDDKKYLELLPEGKIREFCLKFPKKCSKMTKFENPAYDEKTAYDLVMSRFSFEKGYKPTGCSNLEYTIYRVADKLELSFDETCQEIAKATEMYSKLEEAEKATKRVEKILIKMDQMKNALLEKASLFGNEFWIVSGEE